MLSFNSVPGADGFAPDPSATESGVDYLFIIKITTVAPPNDSVNFRKSSPLDI